MASVSAFLLVPALLVALSLPAAAQPTTGPAPLSVEEVLKLCQGGFSEDLIITRIKKNGKPFNLSTDELVALKKSGVSENVIKYLLDPSQPYSPPAPPPPPAPPAAPPVRTDGAAAPAPAP